MQKQNPFLSLFIITTVSIFIFGFQLNIWEGPIKQYTGFDYTNIYNCVWNVVIIVCTVGYGEMYPVSFFGRATACLMTFWGVFINSMIVVVITDVLKLSFHEQHAFDMMKRLILKRSVQEQASCVFQWSARLKTVS